MTRRDTHHLVQILLDLTRPDGRNSAVSLLKRELECDEIVLFIFDEVVSHYLPAPGFPQSLPSMRSWRNLLGECPVPGTITGELLSPTNRERARATIMRPDQSCALAMLGGVPPSDILQHIGPLLPIAAAALRNEYVIHVKDAELRMAQRSAEEANRIANTLDSVRQELRDTIAALTAQAVELTRSNSELEQFSYMASHDLQEPLRMVSVFGELLKRRYSGTFDTKGEEYLSNVTKGAQRMKVLIDDLLAYARTGADSPAHTSVDLNAVLKATLSNLQFSIAETNAVISSSDLPMVLADETQMVSLFDNLIANAIKYRSADPPRIEISCESKGSEWAMSIQDNGIGIDPAYRTNVFGMFKRLHGQEIPGTGMGLAICKRIVERHRGKIWIDTHATTGTTVRLTLPKLATLGSTV